MQDNHLPDCKHILGDMEIKDAYVKGGLEPKDYEASCEGSEKKGVTFLLYKDNKQLSDGYIARNYHLKKRLVSKKGFGKVAEHLQLCLLKEFRGMGFGAQIHTLECGLYQRNGFDEIVLPAIPSSVPIWMRLGFVPTKKGIKELERLFATFLLKRDSKSKIDKDMSVELRLKDRETGTEFASFYEIADLGNIPKDGALIVELFKEMR